MVPADSYSAEVVRVVMTDPSSKKDVEKIFLKRRVLAKPVSELAELWTVGEERGSVTSYLCDFAEALEGEELSL
jgi:hypothetical protein